MKYLLVVLCIWAGAMVPVDGNSATTPEVGMLLVAREGLADARFREAVVLIVSHGPHGSVGLIINRPSRLALSEAIPRFPVTAQPQATLSYGGPVAPRTLFVLVKADENPPEPAQKILDTVYLTGVEHWLEGFSRKTPEVFYRVFAGYAGWAPGQLQAELTRGDWLLCLANITQLFADDVSGLWAQLRLQHAP